METIPEFLCDAIYSKLKKHGAFVHLDKKENEIILTKEVFSFFKGRKFLAHTAPMSVRFLDNSIMIDVHAYWHEVQFEPSKRSFDPDKIIENVVCMVESHILSINKIERRIKAIKKNSGVKR